MPTSSLSDPVGRRSDRPRAHDAGSLNYLPDREHSTSQWRTAVRTCGSWEPEPDCATHVAKFRSTGERCGSGSSPSAQASRRPSQGSTPANCPFITGGTSPAGSTPASTKCSPALARAAPHVLRMLICPPRQVAVEDGGVVGVSQGDDGREQAPAVAGGMASAVSPPRDRPSAWPVAVRAGSSGPSPVAAPFRGRRRRAGGPG